MSGNVKLITPSNGSVTLSTPDTASAVTVTIPAATDTLVNLASTQTLTNKTLTAAGVNTVEATSGPTSTQLAGQRNKIINGAMMIDQRNAGASVTPTVSTTYTLDRWGYRFTQSSKVSIQQNAGAITPPVGFTNYLGVTSLSAYSVLSTDSFWIRQAIEGFNVADFGFGSSSASSVTLSFWVFSSLTGTFSGTFANNGNTRTYSFTYTINSANTWEKKTVTIAGDTSGTWLINNSNGLFVGFNLGTGASLSSTANTWVAGEYYGATGATSVVGTNGATFYITGVQLEKGATATPFENRLYGTELALCQRYYYKIIQGPNNTYIGSGGATTASTFVGWIPFPVQMRTSPTSLENDGVATDYDTQVLSGVVISTSVPTLTQGNSTGTAVSYTSTSAYTAGQAGFIRLRNAGSYLAFPAEL